MKYVPAWYDEESHFVRRPRQIPASTAVEALAAAVVLVTPPGWTLVQITEAATGAEVWSAERGMR